MKISFRKLFSAALTAALVFAGCSNINDVEKNDPKCLSTVKIDESSSISRQINPDPFTAGVFSKITLSGKSNYGNTLAEVELTFTDGKAQVALEYAIWELTLKAYKTIGGTDQVVLMGKNTADLTNGGTDISFKLTTSNVTTKGYVDLKCIYPESTTSISKIKAGLYNLFTDKAIYEKEIDSTDITTNAGSCTFNFTETTTAIDPGTYTYKVVFYTGTDTKVGLWSDILLIAPGNTTKKTVNIPPVITEKPDSPSNLCAYYVDDTETNGYYNVKLTWEDNSSNEEYYVITINEYDSYGAAAVLYKELGTTEETATNKEVFVSSQEYVSGSILANNTEVELKLPTGKLFDVSIKAVNFVGSSDEVTRTEVPATIANCTSVAANDKITKTMLTYNFSGKTLTIDSNTYFNSYTEYKSWKNDTTGFDLLDSSLINECKGWTETTIETAPVVTSYTSHENKTFYAKFTADSNIDYTIEEFQDGFKDGELTITNAGGSTISNGDTIGNTDEIKVNVSGDYEYFLVKVNGYTYPGTIGGTGITFTGTQIKVTGNTAISIIAKIKNSDKFAGETITLNFSN